MNVLFLSQIVPYPPHGGVLQRGFNLLRELAKNHEVHLIAWVHNDVLGSPQAVAQSRAALSEFCATISYVDVWPKRSRAHRAAALAAGLILPEPFSVTAHRSRAATDAIRSSLRRHRIQIVHYDTIGLARYARLAPDFPSVLTHHNVESELMRRRARVEPPVARAYLSLQAHKLRRWERLMSPRFDLNVVVSDADRRSLESIAPGSSAAVVPNGVDIEYFAPSRTEPEPALVFTGGMNMFANRDAVMHFVENVWPLIRTARPDARFDIIGQDPPSELLAASERDPGLRVHGFVSDIRPYVRKACVYVVPIRVGGGTRLKVLDAMAMGKAIVSTSVGCEGIEVSSGKQLIIADDPVSMSQAILSLLADPRRRDSLGRDARSLAVSRYGWGQIAQGLGDLYRSVVASRRAQATNQGSCA